MEVLMRWLLVLGSLMTTAACAAEPVCQDPKDNVADRACMSAEVAKADAQLAQYLRAAKEWVAKDKLQDLKLDATQAAWMRYRDAQCDDVYRYWGDGTHRYRAAAQCQLDLAHARTYDLWSAYLTYTDSTPPILPKPER
jgi:uncharacterized protein YecT (DUF1311 family)